MAGLPAADAPLEGRDRSGAAFPSAPAGDYAPSAGATGESGSAYAPRTSIMPFKFCRLCRLWARSMGIALISNILPKIGLRA